MTDLSEEQAAKAGVKLIIMDAQNKVEKQIADIEDMVVQKVNAIIVTTLWSDAVLPGIEAANKANIPIVVLMADLKKGAKYDCFITTENFEAGKSCGEAMVKMIGAKGLMWRSRSPSDPMPYKSEQKGSTASWTSKQGGK